MMLLFGSEMRACPLRHTFTLLLGPVGAHRLLESRVRRENDVVWQGGCETFVEYSGFHGTACDINVVGFGFGL